MTANTHLEHPEDLILDGVAPTSLLASMLALRNSDALISVKWDGAPALVWGLCPTTGLFFVGTKSVFNKKRVKINYNHHDIDRNHTGAVANILHVAFECLPIPAVGYVQGDFIGYGGVNKFTPNTVTYTFPFDIFQSIAVALHTSYTGPFQNPHVRYNVSPNSLSWRARRSDQCFLIDTTDAYFPRLNFGAKESVSPFTKAVIESKILFLHQFAKYPRSAAASTAIKAHVNKSLRSGDDIPSARKLYETLPDKYKCEANVNLFRIYHIILQLKDRLLRMIYTNNSVSCSIADRPTSHEGYVVQSRNHTYKFVNRLEFSKANFTLTKNWTNEKV